MEAFRWCVLGTSSPGDAADHPAHVGVLLLASGLMVFARFETRFADEL